MQVSPERVIPGKYGTSCRGRHLSLAEVLCYEDSLTSAYYVVGRARYENGNSRLMPMENPALAGILGPSICHAGQSGDIVRIHRVG